MANRTVIKETYPQNGSCDLAKHNPHDHLGNVSEPSLSPVVCFTFDKTGPSPAEYPTNVYDDGITNSRHSSYSFDGGDMPMEDDVTKHFIFTVLFHISPDKCADKFSWTASSWLAKLIWSTRIHKTIAFILVFSIYLNSKLSHCRWFHRPGLAKEHCKRCPWMCWRWYKASYCSVIARLLQKMQKYLYLITASKLTLLSRAREQQKMGRCGLAH